MVSKNNIELLSNFCNSRLEIADAILPDEYYYQSLPLCVIDSVFSIGIRYASVRNVVDNFCNNFNTQKFRADRSNIPARTEQLSIFNFIAIYEESDARILAEQVYRNKCRTSSRSGILKSEAVLLFARALIEFQVNYFDEMSQVAGLPDFEKRIKEIPGQTSGISLQYFYMLAGDGSFIKPDRWIRRFVQKATGKACNPKYCEELVLRATDVLNRKYTHLTPRLLDYLIWDYAKGNLVG